MNNKTNKNNKLLKHDSYIVSKSKMCNNNSNNYYNNYSS